MLNLSPGGVLVAGELPLSLLDRVSLRLEIGTHAVAVDATVVRLETGRPSPRVAFAFDCLVNEHLIANILAGSAQNQRKSVLIVDSCDVTRRELRFQVRCLGSSCVAVGTPLEAIHSLTEPDQFAAVLVGFLDRPQVARDLLRFLTESHPNLQRLTVSELPALGDGWRPTSWAADIDPGLLRPWSASPLARALGI